MQPSFAYLLRQRRRDAGLTQAELGLRAGVHPRRVSYYENERAVPTREDVLAIAKVLGCDPSCLGQIPVKQRRGRSGPSPLPRGFLTQFGRAPEMHWPSKEVSMRARIHSALKVYPDLRPVARRLLEQPGFDAFTRASDCNSLDEAVVWLGLAQQGACFHRFSHARLGWANAPIVDRSGSLCLTGHLWPALFCLKPIPMVFFPQVRIKTWAGVRRVDINIAVGGKHQGRFFAAEVHGDGHNSQGDEARPDQIRMPVVTLLPADLLAPDLARMLLERWAPQVRLDW